MTAARSAHLPAALLDALETTGPRPALVWYGEEGRTELSGHVLATWVIKSVNHLADEVALEAGDGLLLDLPPHWKRLVLALAGWSLGLEVHLVPGRDGTMSTSVPDVAPRAVATDAPAGETALTADEVLALEALALSMRFGAPLPPLARDWAQEVRASGDALGVTVGPWSGPAPAEGPVPRAVLVASDGAAGGQGAARMLAVLVGGGLVVGPADRVDAAQAASEGVEEP